MTTRDPLEAAAAYALGVVDPAERAALDALMASDPGFRREVERYRQVVGLMAFAAPPSEVPAPDSLRQRILADAGKVRPVLSAPPVSPARRVSAVLPWLAAAACLALAIVSSNRLRAARTTMGALQAELVRVRDSVATRDSTLAAFFGPEVHVVSLAEADKRPSARVYWNHTRSVFIVTAFNVPRAPAGKTWQMWAIARGRSPMSMGTFNTDENGRATVVVPVSSVLAAAGVIDLCGLTLEPEGGSPQPTEAPRLVGPWRHTD